MLHGCLLNGCLFYPILRTRKMRALQHPCCFLPQHRRTQQQVSGLYRSARLCVSCTASSSVSLSLSLSLSLLIQSFVATKYKKSNTTTRPSKLSPCSAVWFLFACPCSHAHTRTHRIKQTISLLISPLRARKARERTYRPPEQGLSLAPTLVVHSSLWALQPRCLLQGTCSVPLVTTTIFSATISPQEHTTAVCVTWHRLTIFTDTLQQGCVWQRHCCAHPAALP